MSSGPVTSDPTIHGEPSVNGPLAEALPPASDPEELRKLLTPASQP
jgi:hypothetical protein